jgi:hypothetical protein
MAVMNSNEERLREVLDKLVERYSWQPAQSLWVLETSWRSVVGDIVANRTKIMGYKPKTLTIAVTSSSWAQSLQFWIPDLIVKINAELKTTFVEEIRTRINLKAFRPLSQNMMRGEGHVRVGRIKPQTQNLEVLLEQVRQNYDSAAEQWLLSGYQPCLHCGSPTLKTYRLCSICYDKVSTTVRRPSPRTQ